LQRYNFFVGKRAIFAFFCIFAPKIAFIMKKFWILAAICTLLAGCRESLEDRCAREAKEYTEKNCPTRMDKNIILDSMAFERDTHTLHYYYTLTGFADRDGVMEEVDARGALKEDLKNSTSLRVYKENKYRFAYTYRSEKDPKKIRLEVVFTDKDY
jgi:hypothetical protein